MSLLASTATGGTSLCGGSIISANWVLTAAHCTAGRTQFQLRFGSLNLVSGGHAQTSFRFVNHANYNPVNLNNDIAVVHIPAALAFGAGVQRVRLPTRAQVTATFAGVQVVVSGWGGTGPNAPAQTMLRWVHKRVISNAQCQATYGTSTVVAHVVCTLGYTNPSNQGACGGDSGGPLVVLEGGVPTQIGVVAFAAHPNIGGCSAGHPNGYMRTASFLAWIQQHTGVAIRG